MTADLRRRGQPLPMPTDFDDFSEVAHQEALAHARRLRQAMERHGFGAFATEWWHFYAHDWQARPVVR